MFAALHESLPSFEGPPFLQCLQRLLVSADLFNPMWNPQKP